MISSNMTRARYVSARAASNRVTAWCQAPVTALRRRRDGHVRGQAPSRDARECVTRCARDSCGAYVRRDALVTGPGPGRGSAGHGLVPGTETWLPETWLERHAACGGS